MKLQRRQFLRLASAAAAVPAMPSLARALDYPTRPITVVVPFSAGGPVDTMARLLSEPMQSVLGQPLIIENATGAGGTIGAGRVARAAPDGYTIEIGDGTSNVGSPAVYPLDFDTLQGFRAGRAAVFFAADRRRPQRLAAEQREGADCLAEGQSRQGDVRHHRQCQPQPDRRALFPESHRYAIPARALSRRGAGS